jgi:2-polyprenyl-3-methyl-5-hydroxy-6-metoxy-1,4-benzoquinol methylase
MNTKVFGLIPSRSRRVLEVGCASGRLGEAVKRRNGECRYVGIEVFDSAASAAREKLDQVFLADVEKFEWSRLAGETFDCIVFADVLEHLYDPGEVLRSAVRLLVPGGSVVCSVPNAAHWFMVFGLMRGQLNYADSGILDRTHIRFFTDRSIVEFLKQHGLEAVAEDRWYTDPQLIEEAKPLIKALQMTTEEFTKRSSTIQIAVRAEKPA